MFDDLARGPEGDDRTTAISPELDLVTVGEIDEGFLLELGDTFWQSPRALKTAAVAQIVFTFASLEEGKKISLLKGALPGPIPLPNGKSVRRPVTRDDFASYRPWIEVAQPVAGSVVSRAMPIRLILRERGQVLVHVFSGGQSLIKGGISGGKGYISIPESSDEIATVELQMRAGGATHVVEIPVRLAASG